MGWTKEEDTVLIRTMIECLSQGHDKAHAYKCASDNLSGIREGKITVEACAYRWDSEFSETYTKPVLSILGHINPTCKHCEEIDPIITRLTSPSNLKAIKELVEKEMARKTMDVGYPDGFIGKVYVDIIESIEELIS